MADDRRPLRVAIVGRPNVGKSTLFNRLVAKRIALVDDRPGVTRDRREGEARLGDLRFVAIDTAGLEEAPQETLAGRMHAQAEAAIAEADLALFVIDARVGVTPEDRFFARRLHESGGATVVLANKAEGTAGDAGGLEAYELGFGDPVLISAEHGEGLGELYDVMRHHAEAMDPAAAEEADGDRPVQLAVVGRPNTGKSTLINRLLGEDRLLTGPEAGITRDAIAVELERDGRRFRIFDTAGMRKRARVDDKFEILAVGDALRAIRFAEVVVVMIDPAEPLQKQDLQIADLVEREGRAIVLALGKWDAVDDKRAMRAKIEEMAGRLLPQLAGVALVSVSGLTGKGLDRLMAAVAATRDIWSRRVPTARLNAWLADMVVRHPPPAASGRRVRLRYMTQTKARPPTFVAFCSRPDALPAACRRYLVHGLRDSFGLAGVPVRLILRTGDNPYAPAKKR